jgi:hypothetical protein
VADQGRDAWRNFERFEHVATHEFGQVANRFHRHCLVKQI